MARYLNRTTLLLAIIVLLLPTVYGLFATNTLVLQQAHVPEEAAPTSLPHPGETTTVYDDAGDPALVFQVADVVEGQVNPNRDTLRTSLQIAISNQTSAPVHINPNTMLGVIDTWGAYQSLSVIDAQGNPASSASFELAAGTSQTLFVQVDLPPTAQPNLLVYDAATHFAVLLTVQDAIAGSNQPIMTAAIPTRPSSWPAPA